MSFEVNLSPTHVPLGWDHLRMDVLELLPDCGGGLDPASS